MTSAAPATSAPRARLYRVDVAQALLVGASAGAVYTLSPLAAWSLVPLVFTIARVGRELGHRERLVFTGLVAAGLAGRALAVAGFVLIRDTDAVAFATMFGDELQLQRRALWLKSVALGVPILPEHFNEAFAVFGQSGFNYGLAIVQTWLGESPYALHLVSSCLHVGSSVVLYRAARSAFGRVAAMIGLAALLFMPTMFVWSISVLKESFNVFLNAAAILIAVQLVERRGGARLIAAGTLLLLLLVAGAHRPAAAVMIAAGLLAATVLYFLTGRRRARLACAAAVLVIAAAVFATPAARAMIASRVRNAALTHVAHVQSPGHGYYLLDARFYARPGPPPVDSMTASEMTRFLMRSAASVFLVPLPWDTYSTSELLLLPQQMVWYALFALAIPGSIIGFRRNRWMTCLAIGIFASGIAVIGPHNGNVGTLARFRDLILPAIVWLSALGAEALLRRVAASTARRVSWQ